MDKKSDAKLFGQKMNNWIGKFEAIESFIIWSDEAYGVIGDLKEGKCEAGYYLNIQLNSTLSLTARIDEMKEIKLSSFDDMHTLLLVNKPEEEKEFIEWLYAMNVWSEILYITEDENK